MGLAEFFKTLMFDIARFVCLSEEDLATFHEIFAVIFLNLAQFLCVQISTMV